jgi:PHD/YefM family antitoxin component YafN of YafNO toxin-antitoxin module
MISTQHTQSLTDFRQKANETLDRINQTGAAEILTVNGQARAVLLSPAAFDKLARETEITRDLAVVRQAIAEIDAGKGREAKAFFGSLRKQLLARKTAGNKSGPPRTARRKGAAQ